LSWFLAILYNATLLGVCAWAWLRGGRPERAGALINLAASCLTTGLRLVDPRYFAPAEHLVLGIDCAVMAGFYWLATTTTRFWPIWAFGFALADLTTSLAVMFVPFASLFAYHTGLGLYAYLALAALLIGTLGIPRGASAAMRRGARDCGNDAVSQATPE